MLRSFFTPALLVMAIFFMQAVMLANWIPRIPDVQARLGLGPGDLSLPLRGVPPGSFIAWAVAGPLIHRLTPRRTIILSFIAYGVTLSAPGWAGGAPSLLGELLVLGVASTL